MYVNGIIFGLGEVMSMVLSGFLMQRMMDVTAFRVCYLMGVVGYGPLISFPDSVWLPYFGILLLVLSIGGWINTQFLILEMRVPPQNVAYVATVCRTISVGTAICCPTISSLSAPWPLVTIAILAFFAMSLTFLLPPPGHHLP